MTGFSNVISTARVAVSNAIKTVANAIVNTVKSIPSKMLSIGKNIVKGLWNGISGMVGWITDKVMGFANSVLGGIKKALGIHSPSRVMRDEVGKYMALGLGVGFEKYAPIQQIKGSISDIMNEIDDFANFNPISFSDDFNRLSLSGMNYTLSAEYAYESNETYVIEVPVNIDGKEVSRVTAPFMKKDLDKIEKHNNRKHGIR